MNITRTQITGFRIRARKITGAYWLIYELKDNNKPDYVGNRAAIDMVPGKQEAIDYVESLDEPVIKEGVENG